MRAELAKRNQLCFDRIQIKANAKLAKRTQFAVCTAPVIGKRENDETNPIGIWPMARNTMPAKLAKRTQLCLGRRQLKANAKTTKRTQLCFDRGQIKANTKMTKRTKFRATYYCSIE